MGAINFRDGYEFDPGTYATGGGLSGLLRRAMQQRNLLQMEGDSGEPPNAVPNYGRDIFSSAQGGLLRRLQALKMEQDQDQSIPGSCEGTLRMPRDPSFRQLSRLPNNVQPQVPDDPASRATPPPSIPQSESDQALQAREVAAARVARGVRSAVRANAPAPDPLDIAKSAGIGAVNGAIGIAGLPGDVLTGFGHFPKNAVPNLWRRSNDLPPLPDDAPDYFESWNADAWRHSLENLVGELYQPKTAAGRYAETIGEMVPTLVGGEGLVAARNLAKSGAVLRRLPATLSKHAVLPGVAVQAMEDAYPESSAGQALQKGWPWLRRGVPLALAIRGNRGK